MSEGDDIGEFLVKLIDATDPSATQDYLKYAKMVEVDGLKRRIVWSIVSGSDVPGDANVQGGIDMLTLRNHGTPDEKSKVRYIPQGYNDDANPFIVHDTATLRASSIRLILAGAAVLWFRIFSHDVSQAYMQSKYKLIRNLYLSPKKRDLATIRL